jgi:PAS domain S-box-containing protein
VTAVAGRGETPIELPARATSSTWDVIRRALYVFLPAGSIVIFVCFALYRTQTAAAWSIVRASELGNVDIARQRSAAAMTTLASDLGYLAQSWPVQQWVATGSADSLSVVGTEFVSFATHRQNYDQIRLLDLEGREIVRVDWNSGQPVAMPSDRLQNKGDRYYVRETLKLARDQIYMSPFDLNVEGGQIEQPIKSTIRLGTLVYNGAGQRRAMVILNYLGQRLLDRLRSQPVASGDHLWLLNGDGSWLLGPTPEDEWDFMYPERAGWAFSRAYPAAWAAIRAGGPAGQITLGGDLFTYARLDGAAMGPVAPAADGATAAAAPWIVIAYLPAAAFAQKTESSARILMLAGAALLLVLAAVSWIVAYYWAVSRKAEATIRHNEAHLRGLLDSAPDAIVVTDMTGSIRLVNSQTEQLFGYRRDQLLGQPVEMLVPQQRRTRHVDHRAGYVAAARPRPMGKGLRLYGLRSDGTEVPVAISLSPVRTDEDMLIFSDIRDVTAEREAEHQLSALNERLARDNLELEALNRELEAFSYSVSHDLRAPLRAIDGFSQALEEDCAEVLAPDGRAHLGRIRKAAQRMGQLIDDLLELARVSRADISKSDIDLSAMARGIAEDLRANGEARPVDFTIGEGLNIRGDFRLLRIALENLLGNAWKFSADRRPATIEIGRAQSNGAEAFFVRDNGVGFDMAHANKLFGAFQRLHDGGRFPGTGIGLATVQRIIHRHGGRVWAESAPGAGATFYFTI